MLGALFLSRWENLTKMACSSHAQMTRLSWHAVRKINASPRYSRTSAHWDGKNSLPNSFQKHRGLGRYNVCVWEHGCVFTSVQPKSAVIAEHAQQSGIWGHPQSWWLLWSFQLPPPEGGEEHFLFSDARPDIQSEALYLLSETACSLYEVVKS